MPILKLVNVNFGKGSALIAVNQGGKSLSFHIRRLPANQQPLNAASIWTARNGQRFTHNTDGVFGLY